MKLLKVLKQVILQRTRKKKFRNFYKLPFSAIFIRPIVLLFESHRSVLYSEDGQRVPSKNGDQNGKGKTSESGAQTKEESKGFLNEKLFKWVWAILEPA